MESSLHLPQRMPVSRPARASSKKCFRVSTFSVTAEEAHEHGGGVAPERVGEARAGAFHLTRSGLSTELGDDLRDLGGARGADGMALGLETTGGIDGNLAPEARPSFLRSHAAGARLEEAQSFGGHDLSDGEAVVKLDHVYVGRRLSRLAVRGGRGPLGGHYAREIALLVHEHGVGGRLAGEGPH